MKQVLCALALMTTVISCGGKDNGNGNSNPPPTKPGNGSPIDEDKYLSLMENCDTNTGKAVIDGKCVVLKVTATLDGKLTIASAESDKPIFDSGIGLKATHHFPFIKSTRDDTPTNYSYNLKKQQSKALENSISIDAIFHDKDDLSSLLMVLAPQSKARIELHVFGEELSSKDQDRDNLEKFCKKIAQVFKEKHPLVNVGSFYLFQEMLGSYQCVIGNNLEASGVALEPFKKLRVWWRCESEQCYFESLTLNGL